MIFIDQVEREDKVSETNFRFERNVDLRNRRFHKLFFVGYFWCYEFFYFYQVFLYIFSWKEFNWHFFTSCFFSILFENYSYRSGHRNSEYDSENTAERSTDNHHNKYEKWWKIQRSTHDIRDEEVVLCLLDADIENHHSCCDFPRNTKSDNHRWNKGKDWT